MIKTVYFLYDDVSKRVVSMADAYTDEQMMVSVEQQLQKLKDNAVSSKTKLKYRFILYKLITFNEHTMDIDSGFVVDGKPMRIKTYINK